MAITPFCTISDVEVLWSEFGVDERLIDEAGGTEVSGLADSCLELVTSKIMQKLCMRYDLTHLQNSAWVKWCCATLTAEMLGMRRGNPVPLSIVAEADRYREDLTAISHMQLNLIGDTGVPLPARAIPGSSGHLPAVSNVRIDGRYQNAKVRRVDATSTQLPSVLPQQWPTVDPFLFP